MTLFRIESVTNVSKTHIKGHSIGSRELKLCLCQVLKSNKKDKRKLVSKYFHFIHVEKLCGERNLIFSLAKLQILRLF